MSLTKTLRVCLIAIVLISIGAWTYARYQNNIHDIVQRAKAFGPLKVHHVADGDSIVVVPRFGSKKPEVRLLGLNTKELEHKGLRITAECWGSEAFEYVKKIVEGKIVGLEFDPLKNVTDGHDRLLAYVHVYDGYRSFFFGRGLDLNKHLIESGYAEEWLYQGPYTRANEFLEAETLARRSNVGGWAACPDFKKHPREPVSRKKPLR